MKSRAISFLSSDLWRLSMNFICFWLTGMPELSAPFSVAIDLSFSMSSDASSMFRRFRESFPCAFRNSLAAAILCSEFCRFVRNAICFPVARGFPVALPSSPFGTIFRSSSMSLEASGTLSSSADLFPVSVRNFSMKLFLPGFSARSLLMKFN